MSPAEFIGPGSLRQIGEYLQRAEVRRVLLVTGRRSYESSGAGAVLEELLRGMDVVRFSDFTENPKSTDVEKGVDLFRRAVPDLVIAVGGGSVIDMAKLISIMEAQEGGIGSFVDDSGRLVPRRCRLVAVPTTAGAGSEATHFAVVYHHGVKFSLAHPSLMPDVAVIDPLLTNALSPEQTAVSGADAVCQAVESLWSVRSTEESHSFSREALTLLLRHLPDAVHRPDELHRSAAALGAHRAGQAINIAKTTAAHALSYTLTSQCGIPHGHAVALMLPPLAAVNGRVSATDLMDGRGIEHAEHIMRWLSEQFQNGEGRTMQEQLTRFFRSIGLPMTLSEMGINRDIIPALTAGVNAERLGNNPRRLNGELLLSIVTSCYDGTVL